MLVENVPLNTRDETNRRELQTWIQNVNNEVYGRIMTSDSSTHMDPDNDQIGKIISEVLIGNLTTKITEAPIAELDGTPVQIAELVGSKYTSNRSVEIFDLAPIQRLYFHSPLGQTLTKTRVRNGQARFNQSIFLQLNGAFGPDSVQAAIYTIMRRHPMLNCKFTPSEDGSWCQLIEPVLVGSCDFACHLECNDADVEEGIKSAQHAIDIKHGPVFSAHYFVTADGNHTLYLAAHHLVVDLQSWFIIANDLESILINGTLTSSSSITFEEWIRDQRRYLHRPGPAKSLPFQLPLGNQQYWDLEDTDNVYGKVNTCSFTVGAETLSALENMNQSPSTNLSDVFMAALLLSFAQTFPDRQVPALWNQEYERPSFDVQHDNSETVGWFTSLCPFPLSVSPEDNILLVISRVKGIRLASSKRNVPFFAMSFIGADEADHFISSYVPLELLYTYVGSSLKVSSRNGLLEQIPVPGKALKSKTSDIGNAVGRIAVFEILISVDQGNATVTILSPSCSHHQGQIRAWTGAYERMLKQCAEPFKDRTFIPPVLHNVKRDVSLRSL
ncbi:condensation domain-containing protein [Hypoxylon sp. FL0890]|nr:condensation domain-containing protein [Hypoxylon sp. FL0890]